jgi:UDP-glucose 4-epimerase
MRVLITGGAGFIGSHLTQKFADNGNDVVVLDNLSRGNKIDKETLKKITLIKGDIMNESDVEKAVKDCDYVYHLAAVLGVDLVADNPVKTMETEVIGMRNVVNHSILNGVKKILYASTSGVYGKSAITEAVKEEFNVSPKSSYAIAKRFNEIFLSSYYQEKKISSVSLRFFNVYGPRQDERMVIPRLINQALKNEDLTVFGNGKQTRDFTYIDDVIEASIALMNIEEGVEIFNISNENEVSIIELAQLIVKMTNSKSKVKLINPPSNRYDFEVERRFGNSEKLFKKINFKPNTDIRTGLSGIINNLL